MCSAPSPGTAEADRTSTLMGFRLASQELIEQVDEEKKTSGDKGAEHPTCKEVDLTTGAGGARPPSTHRGRAPHQANHGPLPSWGRGLTQTLVFAEVSELRQGHTGYAGTEPGQLAVLKGERDG